LPLEGKDKHATRFIETLKYTTHLVGFHTLFDVVGDFAKHSVGNISRSTVCASPVYILRHFYDKLQPDKCGYMSRSGKGCEVIKGNKISQLFSNNAPNIPTLHRIPPSRETNIKSAGVAVIHTNLFASTKTLPTFL
jgi:hypothetical protein